MPNFQLFDRWAVRRKYAKRLTLSLPPALMRALLLRAARQGVAPETLALRLLAADLAPAEKDPDHADPTLGM